MPENGGHLRYNFSENALARVAASLNNMCCKLIKQLSEIGESASTTLAAREELAEKRSQMSLET